MVPNGATHHIWICDVHYSKKPFTIQGNNNSKTKAILFYFKIFWSHTSVFWSTQCRGYFKVKLSLEVNSEPSQTSKMGLFLKIVTSLITVEKMQFSLEDVGNWTDTQFPADFFTFTEQIFKWKISFSCWTTSLNVNGVSSFCFNDGFACLCC